MSEAKDLSDRIGRTTVIIDALSIEHPERNMTITHGGTQHVIPSEFKPLVRRAIHAVLLQCRALDAVALAREAGVPSAVEGMEDVTIVVQGPRALAPPKESDEG